jgi:DNA-binding MarR family transcriptional regulator/GNAT superfamily N-acetyltransferase
MTEPVVAVRAFNRFYTTHLGLLRDDLLGTAYTLTEARILFELAQADRTEVTALRQALRLDAGYLSRVLRRFESDGLVTRERSGDDARRQVVGLTPAGREAYATLDSRSAEQVASLLDRLDGEQVRRLLGAMDTIRGLLDGGPRPAGYVIRPLAPGDLGWVVHRHGVRYAEEYGWDATFEALVARIVADYGDAAAGPGAARQAGWIAEVDGEPVGCVFCMRRDDTTAQLRLLLVEPAVRGLGIGGRLVDECLRFARRAGYRDIMLWTNDVLHAARRIYERAGFELEREGRHHSFGHDLVEQVWRRTL